MPLEKLFQCFAECGFFQKAKKKSANKYVGRRQDKWLYLKNDAAVVYKFNSVFRNIANYYSSSTQQRILSRFYYALKKSAALTIAHRNSKKHASWTLKKYGKNMVIFNTDNVRKDKFVEIFIPKTQKIKWRTSFKNQ